MMMEVAEAHRQQVGIGELKIGASCDVLQAILGSCVGIAFIWKNRGRCALAHCLLPEAPGQPCGLGARYVSQAIPSMLALMGAHQCDYADIDVVVAGGASMFKGRSQCLQVGQANAAAAHKYLAQCGLNVIYCDLGGRCGRQISIDCEQQSFLIKEIVHH